MFKIGPDRRIVVNAAFELKSAMMSKEKQLQRNIINVSPIIYMNRNKLKEAPTDIIAKIREYSADKSIIDEVGV